MLQWHRKTTRLYLLLSAAGALLFTLLFHFVIVGEEATLSANLNRLLGIRNFYVLPLLLMFCAATSIAEEKQSGWTKEALSQPISRPSYLQSKLLIAAFLSVLSLGSTALPAMIFFPPEAGDIGQSLSAYGLCVLSDVLLIEITFLVSTFARSAGAAALYTFFAFIAEGLARLLFNLSRLLFSEDHILVDLGPQITQWMPGSIIGCWAVWKDDWTWYQPVALIAFVLLLRVLLHQRMSRIQL